MEQSVKMKYLQKAHESKTMVKVFLESGSGQPKTMLSGRIKDFDKDDIVLDECLISVSRIISIAPYTN